MEKFFVLLAITAFYGVNALKYRGHLLGYNIPPPKEYQGKSDDSVSTGYFAQRVDQFDPTNKGVWSQRYFVNTQYMNTSARNVAFLNIAGESQASIGWMTYGSWIDYAQTYNAILFSVEHRYFGTSQPFSNWATENLRFLSSQQALADLAAFISAMNKEYNLAADVEWIVFGGSYAGSLAAWARQKYPHLVRGAVSSSAPMKAQLDFPEYLQVVIDALALHSQACVDNLKTAVTELDSLIQNSNEVDLNNLFLLCDDIEESANNPKDLANLFELIADNFAAVVQYNNFLSVNVTDVCNILTDESKGSEVYRLAEVNNKVVVDVDGDTCFDYRYDKMIQRWQNATITESGMMRQWVYQTCTQFGYYQTSSQEDQVFGDRFGLDFFTQECVDIYGAKFNETFIADKVNRTNVYYGAFDIQTSNVVFVHGSIDPWHVMGITETPYPETPVILINGTAHCADLYPNRASDIPALRAAREEIKRLIGVWLRA